MSGHSDDAGVVIKRVPTVVSNYQKEEAENGAHHATGCGRNCLRSCCLPGAKLPLYAFKKVNKVVSENKEPPPVDFLSSLLLGEWEDRLQRGLFRYDVTACETKVIPGTFGFIAQLNEGRHLKKRPTEFRVDKVLQPFDESKFNFTKVGQEEFLFQFQPSRHIDAQFIPNAPIDTDNSPSFVAINVSPIEYGHVLLIPRILECLPQRIDRESFSLALHMAVEAGDPYFRLGYNSLGAFATINHLHFQAYYLAMPFPVERAPTKRITTASGGVKISYILNYPVRVSAELLDTQVNPAVWEISGHMVLKRKEDYEGASEENAWRLLAEVSLSEERLREVKELIFEAICCNIVVNEVVAETTLEETAAVATPQSHEATDAVNGSHAAMVMPV
ncbi:gdp-l-galactose phosphorylase 1 [Phtheirospermum japonicum]|uniref:Gdp-l-galactose phosphorylase 1 n=1 Tax=Phtheirospermum japonicum TaxID=374723 RepID=A0A830AWZ4_9LAMI|nr:gdp-l-galactose phosphorylase 1 [Phtheirospermum japonicum]